MTRYVITGAGGMLGRDLQRALAGRDVRAFDRATLDVTDADAVAEAVRDVDVIINAAAYTRVDDAEAHEAEALAVNGDGAANLAAAAGSARLVQLSTDYVFDGLASEPYAEDAPLAPVSVYGRTKADGERRVQAAHGDTLVVRTAWLYGQNGPNFARTMLRLADERDTVDVVDDQMGQPTWTWDLANQIVRMLDAAAPAGVYHGTNQGAASRYDFARAVFSAAGHDPNRVRPSTSAAFNLAAPRPAYTVLGHERWHTVGIPPMRDWRDALDEAFASGALRDPDSAISSSG